MTSPKLNTHLLARLEALYVRVIAKNPKASPEKLAKLFVAEVMTEAPLRKAFTTEEYRGHVRRDQARLATDKPRSDDPLARAILRVGDGRGFVVARRGYLNREERVIITAAHCLPRLPAPYEHLLALPTPHPARYTEEETYQRVLGPLGRKRTVWASCLFVDPMADIAVLGQPDNQELSDEADAYDQLVENMTTLAVADAPAQGSERLTDYQIDCPTPGQGPARVLSLDGRWLDGQVSRRGGWLEFEPGKHFVGGMSGSPIIDAAGAAIGVVSVDRLSPVIVESLSAQLVRSLRALRLA
jgi:hypothetical protein